MITDTVCIVLIAGAVVIFCLAVGGVILALIRKRYSLNWYQKTALRDTEAGEDNKYLNGSLNIVRHQVKSKTYCDQSSSSDDEFIQDDKTALLGDRNSSPNLLDRLSKKVGFIQPEASDTAARTSPSMGAEQSKRSSFKPILKHQKSDSGLIGNDRRFSAPVIYGKASAETMGHAKLSATRSAPYGSAMAELDDKSFTVPLSVGDGVSPTAKARLARRRTSMQDSIDATNLNPEFYKTLERTPTIKEESSVDISEPIGMLFMTVQLTTDTGLLRVTLHKADFTGFPNSQLQLRMPYFNIFVTGCDSPIRHTKHSEDALHPDIEETFLFEVGDELLGQKLVCQLYDFDQFVKSEKVGVVQIRVNTIPSDESLTLQRQIETCSAEKHAHDKDYVGELLFSINTNKCKDTITIVVAKAKDLHIEDEISVLGLIVKVTVIHLGQRYKKKKTDNVKLSINPSFNQALTVQLTPQQQLQDVTFILDVCKVRISSTTEVIGRVTIGAEGGQREKEHWKEVQQASANTTSLEWWHQLKCLTKKPVESKT